MRIAGIIAEYNPFHSGHAYQIEALRKMGYDAIVCVMSQSTMQRGELAILSPQARVSAAIRGGVDLVVDLPSPCVLQSAEGFASEGVKLLSAMGCVETLCFGTECDNTQDIMEIAQMLQTQEYKDELKCVMSEGGTYANAAATAAAKINPKFKEILSTPNNVLGVEYCKAILLQNSPIKPLAIRRKGVQHNDAEVSSQTNIASATALRNLLLKGNVKAILPYVPERCAQPYIDACERKYILNRTAYSAAVLSRLRQKSKEELAQVQGVSEGIENRLYAAVRKSGDINQLYTLLKTKRYTHSRVRRLVLCAALGYNAHAYTTACYIHVCGSSSVGLTVLSKMKEIAAVPVSSSLKDLAATSDKAAALALAHAAGEDLATLCYVHARMMGTAYTERMVLE